MISNTTKKIDVTLDEIGKLKPKLQDVKTQISQFKQKINNNKTNTTKEEKQYFEESLTQMNANYTSMSNIVKMESKLTENKALLESIKKDIDKPLEYGEEKLSSIIAKKMNYACIK